MKPEEARIVSHVCADGWLTSYIERNSLQIVDGRRYRRERRRYCVGYCNTEKILLEEFKNDVRSVFGIKTVRIRFEMRFKSKRVFDRISELGGGDSRHWFVSKAVKHSTKTVRRAWLRAFFDDEATVDMKTRRIRVKSMNQKGLMQVASMLRNLRIGCQFTGPNVDSSFYLTVPRNYVKSYLREVGFLHPPKAEKLNAIVSQI
jgi:hypothetical protein